MFWIWAILAAVFIVGEIFTAGFFLFPFGVGAGVAAILTAIGAPSWLQWTCFVVISGVMVLLSRRLADKVSKAPPEVMGVDRLIGKVGVVTESIDPLTDSGRVRVKKDHWRAASVDDSRIGKDETVRVVKVEGVHLVVERVEQEEGAAQAKEGAAGAGE
jgi:membrane protein implicated in regulation of membrane protease activity